MGHGDLSMAAPSELAQPFIELTIEGHRHIDPGGSFALLH
jgi:hypothetical protein